MRTRSAFLNRLMGLARKELAHIIRDPSVVYMALGMPIVLLVLFGFAVSFDLDRLPLAVVDRDHTPASRHLVEALTASDAFQVKMTLADEAEVQPAFRRGDVKVGVVIPKGYARDLARGEPAEIQMLLDGSDGATTSVVMGYAAGFMQAQSEAAMQKNAMHLQIAIEDRIVHRFNPQMTSARFIVPGLIALILSVMAVLLTALTVAREWERGSMEQLFATPAGRVEVILGKLAPYIGVGMVQVLLVVTLGTWLFNVPIRGSAWLLFGSAFLFLVGMLGQGLLISVVTRNQQVATQIGVISSMLPTMLLSGFMFPVENMPSPLRFIAALLPSRYFITVLRGIMLKGSGFEVLWPNLLAMAAFGAVMIGLSSLRFRRSLDV